MNIKNVKAYFHNIKKPTLTVMSLADKVKGQGVGAAYLEQLALVTERLEDQFDFKLNTFKAGEITHYHSINFRFYLHALFHRKHTVRVGSVHFIPETVEGSIKLPNWMKKIFYWYILEFYRTMDALVTVNPVFIDKLEALGFPRDKVNYIPNFVSKEQFHRVSSDEKRKLRKKYDIGEDEFVVLGVGQVQTRKGILDFVKVAEKCPHIQFLWAGGFSFGKITDGFEALNEVVKNPPKNVKFVGIVERSEMNALYNTADVMFLPSYSELFPMTILESMNVKLPMVLRDLDLYEDILFDYYLKANDNDTFEILIKKLANDMDFYRDWANQSEKGSLFYERDSVGSMWDAYYEALLGYESRGSYEKKSQAYN